MSFDSNPWEKHYYHFIDKKVESQKGNLLWFTGYEAVQSGIRSRILYSKTCTLPQRQIPFVGSQSIKILFAQKEHCIINGCYFFPCCTKPCWAHSKLCLSKHKGFLLPILLLPPNCAGPSGLLSQSLSEQAFPSGAFFNKHTTLVLINFIEFLISSQI